MRPTVGRLLAEDFRKIGKRQSAASWPTVGQLLAKSRPTVFWGAVLHFFPNYSNYTGYFAPLLAPHTKFPFLKGFVPNSCLSAKAAVPYSATPSSVATSKIGPSQSSLQRNAQDLQNRELATAVSLLKSTIARYFNVYEEGLHLKVSKNGKIENAWPSSNGKFLLPPG